MDVFSDWEGKAAIITLERIGLPNKIASVTVNEIVTVWREDVKRAVGVKKAQMLIEAASSSVGPREGLEMAGYEIQLLMREYREVRTIMNKLEVKLEEIALTIPAQRKCWKSMEWA